MQTNRPASKRTWLGIATIVVSGVAALIVAGQAWAAPGDVVRVSLSSQGEEGSGNSEAWGGSMSADGRYIAFVSESPELVPGDTNGEPDAFVHDRITGDTRRVSVSSAGVQANGSSLVEISLPRISSDGGHVVFASYADNLVPGDTNGMVDVFVHELSSGVTTRASLASGGGQATGPAFAPDISADGRFVTFASWSDDLVPGDTNGTTDVFVRDRHTGTTERVSVASNGVESNEESNLPSLSANGRYVAFYSEATNLVPNDTNGHDEVFVHDRLTGQTTRVSVSSQGGEADGYSTLPVLSANGRYVVFTSHATNLVPGDTNGMADVFVHDRDQARTRLVSVHNDGTQGDFNSQGTDISGSGRFVVFFSEATNLIDDDTNGKYDVFVHDNVTGDTRRVSVAGDGTEANAESFWGAISGDGRYVGFASSVSNLVPGDTNGTQDVFVYQLLEDPPPTTSTTTITSTTSTTMPPPVGGDYFIDDDGHVFEDDIDWLYESGITKGCNPPINDRFCPDDRVSRGQMAAFLVRALGYVDDGGGDLFLDDDGSVFEGDIDRLGTVGVTRGCNPPVNDRFCPDDHVTRGQMAAFLRRAAELR